MKKIWHCLYRYWLLKTEPKANVLLYDIYLSLKQEGFNVTLVKNVLAILYNQQDDKVIRTVIFEQFGYTYENTVSATKPLLETAQEDLDVYGKVRVLPHLKLEAPKDQWDAWEKDNSRAGQSKQIASYLRQIRIAIKTEFSFL